MCQEVRSFAVKSLNARAICASFNPVAASISGKGIHSVSVFHKKTLQCFRFIGGSGHDVVVFVGKVVGLYHSHAELGGKRRVSGQCY